MRQPTIKEMRTRDALRLAERLTADPTPEEIEAANKAMRKFYIFAAAYQRSFYTEQNRNASEAEKAAADDKSDKAYKRAAEALKPYKLKIALPGLFPIIEEMNGAHWTMGHYYL